MAVLLVVGMIQIAGAFSASSVLLDDRSSKVSAVEPVGDRALANK